MCLTAAGTNQLGPLLNYTPQLSPQTCKPANMAAAPSLSPAASLRMQDIEKGTNMNPIPGLYKFPVMAFEDALRMAAAMDAELDSHLSDLTEQLRLARIFISNFLARPPPLPHGVDREPLSGEEILAVHLYTRQSAFFSILNTRLRAEDRTSLKPFLPLLKLLLTAVYKLPQVRG